VIIAAALNGDAWRVNWSRIRSWCVASIKCPSGAGHCLEWIYFGYADDTPEMRKRRLRHLNLGRPAGFVSMEDGCVGGFVERGIATADNESAIVARVAPTSQASPPVRPRPRSAVSGLYGGS
jgi:hypothetical protein